MYNEQMKKDIQDIMDEFDWQRVLKTMQALDWSWASVGGVPQEVATLKKTASMLLHAAVNAALQSPKKKFLYTTSTGGFEAKAQKFKDDDKIYLELKFVVTEWSNYE